MFGSSRLGSAGGGGFGEPPDQSLGFADGQTFFATS
jgi:hypothetical protein